jgi:hypothetical protein
MGAMLTRDGPNVSYRPLRLGAALESNMNDSTIVAPVETGRTATAVRRPVASVRTGDTFYVGMSAALLIIVLVGFSRTFYLREFFDVARIPGSVWLHGSLLTAWFVGALLQTVLVANHRIDIHRRLGWAIAGIGAAVLTVSTAVTLNMVPRRRAAGIERGLNGTSIIVWGDLSALLAFAVFLSAAILLRRRRETHKRLMLLASISLMQPAVSRISRWPLFAGVDNALFSVGGVLLLLLALVLYDVASRKRLHAATLLGGSFMMGLRIASIWVIAVSEAGRSFVRGL